MRRRGSAFGILLVLILMAVMGSFNSHEGTAAQQDITPQMPTTANLANKHSFEAGKSQFDPVSSTKPSSLSPSPSNSYSSSSSSSSNNYGTYVAIPIQGFSIMFHVYGLVK